MNSSTISQELAASTLATYGLEILDNAEPVSGGLQHRLLRLVAAPNGATGKQKFALKLLASRSTDTVHSRQQLERAEQVAMLAQKSGIPAMTAIPGQNGQYLQQVGEQWVILYPWIEGKTLPPTAASKSHCRVIGGYLGRLHALQIRFPDQSGPIAEAFPEGHFREIAQRAEQSEASWAHRLNQVIDELEEINDLAMQSQMQLRDGWVTGHLDCDQKNVLWQDDSPMILDWESAKPVHPALEAMGAGLSWAGQSAGKTEVDSFLAFFGGYLRSNELSRAHLELAIDAVLGKWIIWLEFNLQRLLDANIVGTSEEQIAYDAGMHALGATLKLKEDNPLYKSWLGQLDN